MGGSQSQSKQEDVEQEDVEQEDVEREGGPKTGFGEVYSIVMDGGDILVTKSFMSTLLKNIEVPEITVEEEEEKKEEQHLSSAEREELRQWKSITVEETEKTASDISLLLKSRVPQMVPVCEESRSEVADCYQKNPQKPLMCHSLVEEYKQCVRKARETSSNASP